MARTTTTLVQALLGFDYDSVNSPSLVPFVDSATATVNRVVACAARRGVALSAAEAELVERWLAAHYYAMQDPIYQSKNTEGASASFQGQSGMHLEQTRYGQTAIDMDWSGCLAALNKQARARGIWVGRYPSAQTRYRDKN